MHTQERMIQFYKNILLRLLAIEITNDGIGWFTIDGHYRDRIGAEHRLWADREEFARNLLGLSMRQKIEYKEEADKILKKEIKLGKKSRLFIVIRTKTHEGMAIVLFFKRTSCFKGTLCHAHKNENLEDRHLARDSRYAFGVPLTHYVSKTFAAVLNS